MMTATLVTSAIGAAAATAALLTCARLWRRHDAALWHGLFVTVAAASLACVVPVLRLPVAVSPRLSATVSAIVASPADRWGTALTVIYAAGLCWQLARLSIGFGLVNRVRRSAYSPSDAWTLRVRALAPEVTTPCRLHRRVLVPMTAGWRQPVIILPEAAFAWPADRLRAILLHEQAHVVRRDYLWNIVVALHHAAFWFSPFAWVLARRVRISAELAADRQVSDRLGRRLYAEQLVDAASEFAAGGQAGMFAPGAATAMAARIEALGSAPPERDSLTPSARVACTAAAILIVAAMASWRVSAALPASTGFSHIGSGEGADRHAAQHAARHGAAGH